MATKINRAIAIQILQARDTRESAVEIAKRFNVSDDTVWSIWTGRRWGSLPGRQSRTGPEWLTDEAVVTIKSSVGNVSPEELAERYGCTVQAIISIWRGYRRKDKS